MKRGKQDKDRAADAELDALTRFCEDVRGRHGIEYRTGLLRESRVEYFRGKDFYRFAQEHPERLAKVTAGYNKQQPAVATPLTADAVGTRLIDNGFIVRCDRYSHAIKPGRKKLSKWPYRLVPYPVQTFCEEGFFAFSYNRPHSIWHALAVAGLPAVTIGCCLFPIFPIWAKLCVLYFCLTFLTLIVGFCAVRWLVFLAIWTLLGKRLWMFPNLFAEDATILEAFQPIIGYEGGSNGGSKSSKDTKTTTATSAESGDTNNVDPPPSLASRALVLVTIVALVLVLRYHGPTEAQRSAFRGRMTNSLQKWFEWNPLQLASKGEGEGGVEDILHRGDTSDHASDPSARGDFSKAEYRDDDDGIDVDVDVDIDGDNVDVDVDSVETEDDADRADL